jgi:Lysylphosphatidylglycerol synthase TM region
MLLVCLTADRCEPSFVGDPAAGFPLGRARDLDAMLDIPLSGLRWYNIIDSIGARHKEVTPVNIIAATAVGAFFAQVLPSVAGDGMRAWLLVRLGSHWRTAVTTEIIDRAVGLALFIALGFAILLLPSDLTAFDGYQDTIRGLTA